MASGQVVEKKGRLSYHHAACSVPFLGTTIAQLFDQTAQKYPDKDALVFYHPDMKRESVTFSQLQKDSMDLAASLLDLGCKKGDRVALAMTNSVYYYGIQLSLHRIGANVCLLRNLEQTAGLVNKFECSGLICDLANDLSQEQEKWILEMTQTMKFVVTIKSTELENVLSLNDCLERGRNLPKKMVKEIQNGVLMDDPCMVLMTSGSTGHPKGVQTTHFKAINSSLISAHQYGMNENTIYFIDRPMMSVAGCLGGTLLSFSGATVVTTLPNMYVTHSEKFISMMLDIIQREKATHTCLLQHQMYDVINLKSIDQYNLSSLKYALTGGQVVPKDLVMKAIEKLNGLRIITVYGLTEAGISCHPCDQEIDNNYFETVGKVIPHLEVKVVDENNLLVPLNTPGELCVRGFNVFSGYYGDKSATESVLTKDGWLFTGDVVSLSQEGFISIHGRKSQMIKCGLMKVFPAHVESVLAEHPGIKQVVVVEVPDLRLGQHICACIIPKEQAFSEKAFLEWCNNRFTKDNNGLSQSPKYAVLMEEFPLIGLGKIDKRSVQKCALDKLQLLQ